MLAMIIGDNMEISVDHINLINKFNSKFRIIRTIFGDSHENTKFMDFHKDIGFPTFDYVRLRTLGLCTEEIKRKNIPGSVAEAGVFLGYFSVALNNLLPERRLYLYDTFNGFPEDDINNEIDPELARNASWYKSINENSRKINLIEFITQRLPYPGNAIFRQGYFPDSAINENNEKFCMVSIDMDLYTPTLAALKFFYPRLCKGGYIFVHDGIIPGVKRAIQEFEKIYDFPPMAPICDPVVSYIFCK